MLVIAVLAYVAFRLKYDGLGKILTAEELEDYA